MKEDFDYFSVSHDDITEANELLLAQHELFEDYDRYELASYGLQGIVDASPGSHKPSRVDKKRLRSGEWLNELESRSSALWGRFAESKGGTFVINEAYTEKNRRDAASQKLGSVAYKASESQLDTIEEYITLKGSEHYLRQLRDRSMKARDSAEIAIKQADHDLARLEGLRAEIDSISGES